MAKEIQEFRLNPFLIRAKFLRSKRLNLLPIQRLNPFLIRAKFLRKMSDDFDLVARLNPFLIRAKFLSSNGYLTTAAMQVLIPS